MAIVDDFADIAKRMRGDDWWTAAKPQAEKPAEVAPVTLPPVLVVNPGWFVAPPPSQPTSPFQAKYGKMVDA